MKEAADAVANVWLNYRYNIQTNLLTIEDAIKTLQYELKKFVRFRETSNGQPDWEVKKEGWTYSNNVQLVDRTLIKRLIDITVDFPKFKHLVLSNVVVTGYELLEQVMTHEEIVEFLNKSRSSKLVNTYHYQSESFFTGNILGINITIPLSLYAQLIRHRPLVISSNLLTDKFSVSTPISDSIDVFVVGTMDTWKHIVTGKQIGRAHV